MRWNSFHQVGSHHSSWDTTIKYAANWQSWKKSGVKQGLSPITWDNFNATKPWNELALPDLISLPKPFKFCTSPRKIWKQKFLSSLDKCIQR